MQIAAEVSKWDLGDAGSFCRYQQVRNAVRKRLLLSLVEIACFGLDLKAQQPESAGLRSAEWVRRVGGGFKGKQGSNFGELWLSSCLPSRPRGLLSVPLFPDLNIP